LEKKIQCGERLLDQLLKDNLTEKQFTDELIRLIAQESFEYGIDTKADMFIREYMIHNEHVTKHWLFRIYKAYCKSIPILLGLLRIIFTAPKTSSFKAGM